MIMKLSELPDVDKCFLFEYEADSIKHGSRIGGHPPIDALPRFHTPRQKYFGTIQFEDGWLVSIFYSFEIFGDDEEYDVILHNNQVLYPSEWINAVVHQNDIADDQSNIPSEVTCHRIKFEASCTDITIEEPGGPHPLSKVFGRPYVDNAPLVGSAFEQLLNAGYRQLFQFDTPNLKQYPFVEGFPWDPGWLHVFVRGSSIKDWEFAFIVQQ